jgi:hypothetical protein
MGGGVWERGGSRDVLFQEKHTENNSFSNFLAQENGEKRPLKRNVK